MAERVSESEDELIGPPKCQRKEGEDLAPVNPLLAPLLPMTKRTGPDECDDDEDIDRDDSISIDGDSLAASSHVTIAAPDS